MTIISGDGPIKILLVDDHAIIREGLRMLLSNQPSMKVVGEAGNVEDACAAAAREQPDIILLDIDLGNDNGLDALPRLLAAAPEGRCLILTSATDQETHARAMRQGAMGLVSKDKVAAVLLKAIMKVNEGEVWFDRTTMGTVLTEFSHAGGKKSDPEAEKIESLTVREREVVALLCDGYKNKQIGQELFISETTVRHHLTSIFSKLGVEGRLGLMLYAFRQGLAKPPANNHK